MAKLERNVSDARGRAVWLSYTLDFPWFRTATLDQLFEVELLHEAHLYWPGLDVDLKNIS